jgi:drug/metabolite transporter (DMT)-like permease
MYVVSRLAFDDVPPNTLGLVRLLVGVPALLIVLRRLPRLLDLRLVVLGTVLAATLVLQFWGTRLAGAAAGSLLTLATPVFVAVLAPVLLHEEARARQWAGIAIALAGAVAVSGPAGGGSPAGDALLLASALTWALFTVLGARVVRERGPLEVTAGAAAWAMPPMVVASMVELLAGAPFHPRPASILAALYLGLGATALAWWAWYKGVQRLPAARSAVLFLLQPIVGIGLSFPVFGLRPTLPFAAGTTLVVAGTVLAGRGRA